MVIFFFIDDRLVNFHEPAAMIKDEYYGRFAEKDFAPFILSELCAMDMLYAVTNMRDGYYRERLVLKGGLSVRSAVPLASYRFSFDADFDPNTPGGFSYRDVSGLKDDITEYGAARGCNTRVNVTRDEQRLHFVAVEYRQSLENIHRIIERPKIEVCKTCRVHEMPVLSQINTIIDLELLGLEPPVVAHLSLEEQFAAKLHVIGSNTRQRKHFDAYDSFMMFQSNKIDMKKARSLFETRCANYVPGPGAYVEECRRCLDTMLRDGKKRTKLEETAFAGGFDFDAMINEVKSFYDFPR